MRTQVHQFTRFVEIRNQDRTRVAKDAVNLRLAVAVAHLLAALIPLGLAIRAAR